jgi:hypothetical protein
MLGRMRKTASAVALLAVLSACGSAPPKSPPAGVDGLTIPTPSPDPADFVATIDNPWLPFTPGSTWVYRTTSSEGEQTDTVTVLDRTKVVAGVTTTVVHDLAVDEDGATVEDTYDWYAQDSAGNVWYFGEDTTAYEDGKASTEGSWESGVDGAQAGLVMLATPRVGDGYRQEFLEGTAEDQARILSLTATATSPAGDFSDVVQTEDTTPLEPEVVERKYYARGVGTVREEDVTGGDEVVVLLSYVAG